VAYRVRVVRRQQPGRWASAGSSRPGVLIIGHILVLHRVDGDRAAARCAERPRASPEDARRAESKRRKPES
jgi:hypothetical protein